jgi:hypothetical protein
MFLDCHPLLHKYRWLDMIVTVIGGSCYYVILLVDIQAEGPGLEAISEAEISSQLV